MVTMTGPKETRMAEQVEAQPVKIQLQAGRGMGVKSESELKGMKRREEKRREEKEIHE